MAQTQVGRTCAGGVSGFMGNLVSRDDIMHTAMPHERVGAEGKDYDYDGLVECLALVYDLMGACDNDKCEACRDKVLEHGFTQESWNGYQEFMKRYDPGLGFKKIMPKLLMRMPIWHKAENRLVGFLDRTTGLLEPAGIPATPVTASWLKENCRFS